MFMLTNINNGILLNNTKTQGKIRMRQKERQTWVVVVMAADEMERPRERQWN